MAGVRVTPPEDQRAVNELIERDALDRGEAEAIAIALELKADLLLIDERRADARARAFGLETLGVLGLLVEAKRQGHVAAVRPLLDRLGNELNFFMSAPLRSEVLRLAQEERLEP